MWSKLGKRIKNILLESKDEETHQSPSQVIDLAIQEIEQTIRKQKFQLNKGEGKRKELKEKVEQFHSEAEQFHELASKALKLKKESQAQLYLEKKVGAERQLENYQQLYNNVSNAVQQMELQIENLTIKLEENKSKKVILVAKLQSAQSQSELNEVLSELDSDASLGLLEEEVIKNEIIANTYQEPSFQPLRNDNQPSVTPNNLDGLKEEVEAAEKAKQREKEAEQMKKVEKLFSLNEQSQQKSQLKPSKNSAPTTENFFNTFTKPQDDKIDNEDILSQFFNNAEDKNSKIKESTKHKEEERTEKGDLINSFFKTEKADTSDKQRKIDDFF